VLLGCRSTNLQLPSVFAEEKMTCGGMKNCHILVWGYEMFLDILYGV